MAEQEGKGWFAILLANELDHQVVIPAYIRKAILFAHSHFSRPLIARILQYRATCLFHADPSAHTGLPSSKISSTAFGREKSHCQRLEQHSPSAVPYDAIDPFLAEMI